MQAPDVFLNTFFSSEQWIGLATLGWGDGVSYSAVC